VANSLFTVRRWVVDDENRAAFQRWARRVLAPLARSLGWRTHPRDFDVRRNARRAVLNATGLLTDDGNARRQADALALAYLRAPTEVDAELAAVALPVSSRRAGAARYDALLAALPGAATPQDRSLILGAMVSFDDPALVQRAWAMSLGEGIRMIDFRALFGRGDAGGRHPGLLAAWAQANWDAFERRHGRNVRHLLGSVGGLCDAAAIDRAVAFFGPKAEAMDGGARRFALTVESARQCAAVRARSREAATRFWGPAR
jgi:cytosol alanyl aminopeptidase